MICVTENLILLAVKLFREMAGSSPNRRLAAEAVAFGAVEDEWLGLWPADPVPLQARLRDPAHQLDPEAGGATVEGE